MFIPFSLVIILLSASNLLAMEIAPHSSTSLITLLADPALCLQNMRTTHKEYKEEKRKNVSLEQMPIDLYTQNRMFLTQKYEKKHPLFLLEECYKEVNCDNPSEWHYCTLSREHNPRYREAFENKVSALLIEKIIASNGQPVHYTDFGSGGVFQVLATLTKVLSQQQNACLNIHLIDGSYTPYVTATDFFNQNRQITMEKTLNFGTRLAEYAQYVRDQEKDDPEVMAMADSTIQQNVIKLCSSLESKHKQFISSLSNTFPNAQLFLHIHDQTPSYLQYVEKHNLAHADVVTAADISDYKSMQADGVNNYVKLYSATLDKKPNAHNVWLEKNDDQSGAKLTTLSLGNTIHIRSSKGTESYTVMKASDENL